MTMLLPSNTNFPLAISKSHFVTENYDAESVHRKTYENNFHSLLDLADMTTALDKNGPIMQLKVSAITPCLALVCFTKPFTIFQCGAKCKWRQ